MHPQRLFLLTLCSLLLFSPLALGLEETTYTYKDQPQVVQYEFLAPAGELDRPLPVIICVDGLNQRGDVYIHSGTERCFQYWKEFAEETNLGLLSVGFLFKPEHWEAKESYQHAQAWSGQAMIAILEELAKQNPIDPNQLYLFGISAGAQFVVRFAQYWPDRVKAVAAHAAGGFDEPTEFISPKFLITVGELDNKDITRVEWAQFFTKKAHAKGIDVRLVIVPAIGHEQTEKQNELSQQFFLEILKDNQKP